MKGSHCGYTLRMKTREGLEKGNSRSPPSLADPMGSNVEALRASSACPFIWETFYTWASSLITKHSWKWWKQLSKWLFCTRMVLYCQSSWLIFKWPLKSDVFIMLVKLQKRSGRQAEPHLWMYRMWICEADRRESEPCLLCLQFWLMSLKSLLFLEMHSGCVEIKSKYHF